MKINYASIFFLFLALCMVSYSCKTHYDTPAISFDATKKGDITRGKMLVMSSCAGCHYNPATKSLTGKQYKGTPKIAGKVYTANLTQSKTHSPMHKYTVASFAYLMRTGITEDGRFLPYMLRPNMADEDIRAMFAFLHSEDPVVQANNTVEGMTQLSLIGKMGKPFLGKPLPYQPHIEMPNPKATIAYGKYLVDNIGCYHCHSKNGNLNELRPEQTKGFMAGGREFKTPAGSISGSNLTMDSETGIGNYSEEDFRTAVIEGKAKNGRKLSPPMKAFHLISPEEADAIFAYLKTLPPVKNKVK